MLWALMVYFVCTFAFTLALGLMQVPLQIDAVVLIPTSNSPASEDTSNKTYGLLAVSLIGIQALVSVLTLHGSASFPPAAVFVALTLLCHHSVIHRRSRFEGEQCSCAPFQCKDVSNHETWVVAALVAAVVSGLGV